MAAEDAQDRGLSAEEEVIEAGTQLENADDDASPSKMAKIDAGGQSVDPNELMKRVADASGASAAGQIQGVLQQGLADIRSELVEHKKVVNGRLDTVDTRFTAMEEQMASLETRKPAGPGSSAGSTIAGDEDVVSFLEIKGFYNWDPGLGEREDWELMDWIDPLFKDFASSWYFDKDGTRASASATVLHRTLRLYLDLTKVTKRNEVYKAQAHLKRYLALHPLFKKDCFVTVPDPAEKANNSITGKALGIFKRYLQPEQYRIEWATQSIWVKITNPAFDGPRRTIRLVHFEPRQSTWVVDSAELFVGAFGDNIIPAAFILQAAP